MSDSIVFKKIRNQNIFREKFQDFKNKDNKIKFGDNDKNDVNIAVIYAPNGTGKTSLAKVLGTKQKDKNIEFEAKFKKNTYTTENNTIFHIIKDQSNRNIIEGKDSDFLIGDNINKEYKLRYEINDIINKEIEKIPKEIKNKFTLSSYKSNIIKSIKNQQLKSYLERLIPAGKRKSINSDEFIKFILQTNLIPIKDYDSEKFKFLCENYGDDKSIIYKILKLEEHKFIKNEQVAKIEENSDAMSILKKYNNKHECIVCDNPEYDSTKLFDKKQKSYDDVMKKLDPELTEILKSIIELFKYKATDPFDCKNIIIDAIKTGNLQKFHQMIQLIKSYLEIFETELNNYFYNLFKNDGVIALISEYKSLIKDVPPIEDEDMIFIQEFVSNALGREVILKRDNENLKLKLDEAEICGNEDLHLSNGEQNFISLTFEFLKAKKKSEKIIVLDDPISSFDSIFKNKIAFCIIKFLMGKDLLILTHNMDLLRLLEYQLNKSYSLYLLNNSDKSVNGFIEVSKLEKDKLLNIDSLIRLFRGNKKEDIHDYIKNEKEFIISLIPFMRGYANIVGDSESYKKLSKVMHGYESRKINVTKIYNRLFRKKNEKKLETNYLFSAKDILENDLKRIEIIDRNKYSLLDRTLYHTLTYLCLRLKVECTLVKKYKIKIDKKNMELGDIIKCAFNIKTIEHDTQKQKFKHYKAKLSSKKTLLNEFNHFEGNMNIFQPAIDIDDDILDKEINEIDELLNQIIIDN